MLKNKPKYYWDACIFLAWLLDEKRPSGDMEGLTEVATLVAQSNAFLVTSVKKLTSTDSIHLAAAITYGADQFHTFDEPLLRLNGNVAGYPPVICKPQGTQTVLSF